MAIHYIRLYNPTLSLPLNISKSSMGLELTIKVIASIKLGALIRSILSFIKINDPLIGTVLAMLGVCITYFCVWSYMLNPTLV